MIRYRTTVLVLRGAVVLALAGLVGCKQQIFVPADAYQAAVTANLPPFLTENPQDTIFPSSVVPQGPGPASVMDPSRPPRYVTLKECIAIALEQGNTGLTSPFITNVGTKNEISASGTGQGAAVTGLDPIRAFSLDPADSTASIERSLSKFDARWQSSMVWQKVDQPVAAQFLSFQQQRDAAHFESRIDKPLPTGGNAGITFMVDYSKFTTVPSTGGFVNPNYTPRLAFSFEQPLLRMFGVEVNQLADDHPGASLFNSRGQLSPGGFLIGPAVSSQVRGLPGERGILITRIRRDQSATGFEQQVNLLLLNVEAAYWNLYAGYYLLYAQEEGLRQSYEGYRFTAARVAAGTDPPQQLNQSRAQLEQFRAQVYDARGQVLERERQLRGMMGLRSDDSHRLVPIDEPNLAPFQPDFYDAANEAIAMRPELMIARQEVKVAQLQLRLSRNLRRPDLRVFADYDVAGLGTRLDGSQVIGPGLTTPGNAFSSLGNNQFNSWDMGMYMAVPLGFREANATVRQAHLNLARRFIELRDAELKSVEYLTQQYRQVIQTYAQIPPLRERRIQLQEYVYRFRVRLEIGQYQSTEYFNFLQVQRDLADAIRAEFQAVADYNKAIAQFEYAKGTIRRYNNIQMTEAALPPNVAKRAADNERERTEAAIKLRERQAADTAPHSPQHPIAPGSMAGLPSLIAMPPGPAVGPDGKVMDPVPPGQPAPKPLPTPSPLPKNTVPDARLLPAPSPVPNAAVPGAVVAAPPGANPGVTAGSTPSNPDAIFTPTGERLTVPRQPLIVPPRAGPVSGGPTSRVPSAPDGPSVPLLPPGVSSGIPPTLPMPGGPVVPSVPTSVGMGQ
jgi:outer membrane protein TolC